MTRVEALNVLHTASVYHPNYLDALKMAINALEQEPCEDCVSREQALLALTGKNLSTKSTEELISLFNKRIKALPSVTPTRKKGRWKKEYFGVMYDTCSECRQKVISGYFEFNYCPNCGAEMESEE